VPVSRFADPEDRQAGYEEREGQERARFARLAPGSVVLGSARLASRTAFRCRSCERQLSAEPRTTFDAALPRIVKNLERR